MKSLRYLRIEFDNKLEPWEINAFRGAIAAKVGHENNLFHHHDGDSYVFQYPMIQFKEISKKATLVCLEEGVDEINKLFGNKDHGIILNGRPLKLKVDHLKTQTINMQVWNKTFNMFLRNWLPFNQENYEKFRTLEDEISRIEFLEKILKANILSFASGIEWYVDKEVRLRITKLLPEKLIKVKNIRMHSYNLEFAANVFLPDYIGLGKHASTGFGTVKEIRKSNNEKT